MVYTGKIKQDLLVDFGGAPNGYVLDHITPLASDTPQFRQTLQLLMEAGIDAYGPGSQWIEERVA